MAAIRSAACWAPFGDAKRRQFIRNMARMRSSIRAAIASSSSGSPDSGTESAAPCSSANATRALWSSMIGLSLATNMAGSPNDTISLNEL